MVYSKISRFENGTAFADNLRHACKEYYGTAARAFIAAIAPELDSVVAAVKESVRQFVADTCPDDCDGQIKRVAARFGLIAAAGDLATTLGIVPWPVGEATKAAATCLRA